MHLHPDVLPTICDVLNFTSPKSDEPQCHLAPIATWADRWKYRMRWSAPLHYVGAIADHPSQLCLFPGAKGWENDKINVLSGIRNTSDLVEEFVSAQESGLGGDHDTANEALKFLVHFIGDLHQPLHLTGRDRGGNSVKVAFDGRSTNLHSVWDSTLIAKSLRTIPSNYSRPLPLPKVEFNLRQTIYDPYIRRIVWQGILGKWNNELDDWLSCPSPEAAEDPIVPSALTYLPNFALQMWQWLSPAPPQKTDDAIICPYAWAKDIHPLNCDIIWPKALDEEPYKSSRLDGRSEHHHDHATVEEDLAVLDDLPADARPPSKYLELDTPEYAGVIHDEWIIEKMLAQGGLRLAGVLNYLFAPQADGTTRALSLYSIGH
ncbi:phospholipase C/P1 nuclease [Cylindrobasidium torrendii FP15055 ss-10]|uniref:Phospholipase C/P1 nuclease n=1 Tax=Cylindrobasidium torrendii FP15055 ss-10 TaxID=1314674 RepID=A0A0D7BE73_9AGAR|nr:phospholipase C/P1 nuclease [Cylindrobasidium torrendii FP15055 ss-10]